MRYSQIRAFHYVATCGGFSRAADELSVSQPAISEQVRQLESDHDVLLFNRDRKQVTLTDVGERLLIYTNRLFEVEQQISDVLSESRAELTGTIRIIADSAHHLTASMEAFRARHPQVFISIRSGNTAEIITALRNYDAEIGVAGSLNPGADMIVRDLGVSPIIAFAAKKHFPEFPEAMSLEELSAYPLIFRETGSKTRQKLEEEAARRKVTLTPAVEVEGRESMREVVASGAGIGFVSDAEFGYDNRLKKIRLQGTRIDMSESLICLKQRSDVRPIRAFMNIVSSPGANLS